MSGLAALAVEALARDRVRLRLNPDWARPDVMVTGLDVAAVGTRLAQGQALLRLRVSAKVCTETACTYVPSILDFGVGGDFTVEAVNDALLRDPVLLQEDPEGAGWIAEGRLDRMNQP